MKLPFVDSFSRMSVSLGYSQILATANNIPIGHTDHDSTFFLALFVMKLSKTTSWSIFSSIPGPQPSANELDVFTSGTPADEDKKWNGDDS
jgi:hypothetical protein